MHKNWVIKGYDQSVTCLADDSQNLETRSSTLHSLGILSQANNSIHKQSSNDAQTKLQIRRSNQKVQLKNSGLQKESNRKKQRNSNCESNELRLLIGLKSNFTVAKTLFKLVKQKEGVETKIWDFESPDSDSRAKRKTKNKIRAEIAIGIITDKYPEKEN